MENIINVATPHTLRTFKTSNGSELVLKGTEKPVKYTDMGGVRFNETHTLKLYKKTKVDGLDTFTLVGKKEEKYAYDVDKSGNKTLTTIRKERYNPANGALAEQSEIAQNINGGKTIQCNGDVFHMNGNIATNRKTNTPEIKIDLSKGKLSSMAKRIIKNLMK